MSPSIRLVLRASPRVTRAITSRNLAPIRLSSSSSSSSFQSMPTPPRLPAEEQAEWERLQRTANTQSGFNPTSTPPSLQYQSAEELAPTPAADPVTLDDGTGITPDAARNTPLRKGARPEFDGDVNPKTGEVGGPKNEPLRWGAAGDYSYNGRVTDF